MRISFCQNRSVIIKKYFVYTWFTIYESILLTAENILNVLKWFKCQIKNIYLFRCLANIYCNTCLWAIFSLFECDINNIPTIYYLHNVNYLQRFSFKYLYSAFSEQIRNFNGIEITSITKSFKIYTISSF